MKKGKAALAVAQQQEQPALQAATQEGFQPFANRGPTTPLLKLAFRARLLLDFQLSTIYRDMFEQLPKLEGKVLDLGCGHTPYRHLLDESKVHYVPMDYTKAQIFGYEPIDGITYYEGETLPLADASVEHFLCTEVLEHVPEPMKMVGELHRVLRPGGTGVITLPWSARFHFIPHDYHRFTPTALASMLSAFASVDIRPRGTDITSIASKAIAAFARLALKNKRPNWVALPFLILLSPILAATVALGHLSSVFGFGSTDDPLGYTVIVRK